MKTIIAIILLILLLIWGCGCGGKTYSEVYLHNDTRGTITLVHNDGRQSDIVPNQTVKISASDFRGLKQMYFTYNGITVDQKVDLIQTDPNAFVLQGGK